MGPGMMLTQACESRGTVTAGQSEWLSRILPSDCTATDCLQDWIARGPASTPAGACRETCMYLSQKLSFVGPFAHCPMSKH